MKGHVQDLRLSQAHTRQLPPLPAALKQVRDSAPRVPPHALPAARALGFQRLVQCLGADTLGPSSNQDRQHWCKWCPCWDPLALALPRPRTHCGVSFAKLEGPRSPCQVPLGPGSRGTGNRRGGGLTQRHGSPHAAKGTLNTGKQQRGEGLAGPLQACSQVQRLLPPAMRGLGAAPSPLESGGRNVTTSPSSRLAAPQSLTTEPSWQMQRFLQRSSSAQGAAQPWAQTPAAWPTDSPSPSPSPRGSV